MKYLGVALIVLIAWVYVDLSHLVGRATRCRAFDPQRMAYFEAASWRAYYERRHLSLLWRLVAATREQLRAPLWKSVYISYKAVRAAWIFQHGSTMTDYKHVQPLLHDYFQSIDDATKWDFDAQAATHDELQWWMVRRDPQVPKQEWVRLIASVASHVYQVPADRLTHYAELKVQAMSLRDQRGAKISEADWERIERILTGSWIALQRELDQSYCSTKSP